MKETKGMKKKKNFYFLLENTSLSNEDLLIDFVSGNKLNMDVINFFDIGNKTNFFRFSM